VPSVPIRWVLLSDPAGICAPHAWLSTKLALDPGQILTWFVQRWPPEATVKERGLIYASTHHTSCMTGAYAARHRYCLGSTQSSRWQQPTCSQASPFLPI
jgi:hypothetical protein